MVNCLFKIILFFFQALFSAGFGLFGFVVGFFAPVLFLKTLLIE